MLSVTNKTLLSVINKTFMLSATIKPFMQCRGALKMGELAISYMKYLKVIYKFFN
jgi:hypothetical protein